MKATINYNQIKGNNYREVLSNAKKQGYKFIFRWINSDSNWTFFQTTRRKVEKEAIDLYMKEKKELNRELAERFFSEYIDILEINEELKIN
jgi:hypothetical protein